MIRHIVKLSGFLFLLVIILIAVFIVNYQIETRNHVSRFDASSGKLKVVPYFVREKDGSPYTGTVYGTYFGDRLWDLKEWEGSFVEGKPSGEFKYFEPDGSVKSVWNY